MFNTPLYYLLVLIQPTAVLYALLWLGAVYCCLLQMIYALYYFLIHTEFINRSFIVFGSLRSMCVGRQMKVQGNSPASALLPLHTPQSLLSQSEAKIEQNLKLTKTENDQKQKYELKCCVIP